MPVRLHYKIQVGISSTSAEENDLGNAKLDVICDSPEAADAGGSTKYTLVPRAEDVPILPAGTTRFLLVRTVSKDPTLKPVGIDLKRNTTDGEVISVVPLTSVGEGHFLLSTDGLTALYASNPSGQVAMEVSVFAVRG